MNEFFSVFAPYEWIFIVYAICWGFPFGISNTCKRINSWFTGRTLIQSDLGKVLDTVWMFSIVVIYFLNVK